jgi:hypothetical protein
VSVCCGVKLALIIQLSGNTAAIMFTASTNLTMFQLALSVLEIDYLASM